MNGVGKTNNDPNERGGSGCDVKSGIFDQCNVQGGEGKIEYVACVGE